MPEEGQAGTTAPDQNAGAGAQALNSEGNAGEQQQSQQQDGHAQQQQQSGGGEQPWFANISDESLRGWVESKGWKSPEAMAQSAMNLEKMRGVPEDQILKLPRERTPEAMREVFQKLGAPADAKEYQFPDGTTEEQAAWFRDVAHKQGLTVDQAKEVYGSIVQTVSAEVTKSHEQFLVQSQTDMQQLQREWGQQFQERIHHAKAGKQALGLEANEIESLERGLGTKRFMELLAKVGATSQEAPFISGDSFSPPQFQSMSPAAAEAKLQQLKADPAWNDRRLSGEPSAMREYTNLLRIARQ